MKFFALILSSLVLFSFAHIDTLKVNTAESNIAWVGYKVTGQHSGNVKVKNGTLQMNHGVLAGGSFDIDMASITTTDLQGEMAGKLDGHLKADDFFGTEKYPTASFTITRAVATDSKGNYRITGNLKIKETTKEIKFNANVASAGGKVTATGKIVVDRSDFGVRYGSGSFFEGLGDKTIYDEFDLNVSLVAGN
jgi:polyisoprenoid-binding protein YceI